MRRRQPSPNRVALRPSHPQHDGLAEQGIVEYGETLRFGPFPLSELQVDAAAETRLLTLVNTARARESLPPLAMDPDLRAVARAHSAEMFRLNYFSHRSPVTGSPADRIRTHNIPYRVAGENLAYAPTVDVAHVGLMNSPDHRHNILAAEYGKIGIGVVSGGIYGKMFTQNFHELAPVQTAYPAQLSLSLDHPCFDRRRKRFILDISPTRRPAPVVGVPYLPPPPPGTARSNGRPNRIAGQPSNRRA